MLTCNIIQIRIILQLTVIGFSRFSFVSQSVHSVFALVLLKIAIPCNRGQGQRNFKPKNQEMYIYTLSIHCPHKL